MDRKDYEVLPVGAEPEYVVKRRSDGWYLAGRAAPDLWTADLDHAQLFMAPGNAHVRMKGV